MHKRFNNKDFNKNMNIYRVPGDGSCFFHSIGYHVHLPSNDIRKLCAYIALKYASKKIDDISIEMWLTLSNFKSIFQYQHMVQSKFYWGGGLEMLLLSDYFQRPIVVYQILPNTKQAKKIAVFSEKYRSEPVFLLYSNNNHYDALIKK